ncbi:PSD1 and planctomycete cytochrome C domain-containing protein [uncultured Gimesia sp.]|uniref:PSD1 and planctomycete cytochrome C domain-containing protein n=1 Tax=uncultured Gimesia sp. TaxID=1678688 RepID=UPI0030D7893C|tara:strand:+ start:1113 stop:4310 length:3198 start_codon:yes stop_codon:yes gene_type:complete
MSSTVSPTNETGHLGTSFLWLVCIWLLTLVSVFPVCESTYADDRAALALFENEIRPLLIEHCISCHGPQKAEAGLRLDQRSTILKGGDTGPAVIPGKPETSLLIQALRHADGLEMPPEKQLEANKIAAVTRWVKQGAVWPEGMKLGSGPELRSGPITEKERSFWSFQPIQNPAPPTVDVSLPVFNDIDRFIHAKLIKEGLAMSPAAEKRTLLRRATFDLTGLPPTQAEMQSFLNDDSPQAFAKVVDRLLQSKSYGERWGRHWLDVVRYADTAGETADYPAPLAFNYRNWVIDSMNQDMPYDDFVRQQIAGDILARQLLTQSGEPLTAEAEARYRKMHIATGFIAISRRFGFDVENYHHLTIQDTLDTVGQAVLGLSMGCARCHDHKYDPINMTDYYAWYGIFSSSRYSFPGSEEKKRPYDTFSALSPKLEAEKKSKFETQLAVYEKQIAEKTSKLKGLEDQIGAVLPSTEFCGFEKELLGRPPMKPYGFVASATISASAQSPYANVFPVGTRGLAFPGDTQNNAVVRTLQTTHTPDNSPELYFNLDFRNTNMAGEGNGAYRIYLGQGPGHSAAVEMGVSATTFFVKNGNKYEPLCEVKQGQWYNLWVKLNLKNKTVSGVLTGTDSSIAFVGKGFTAGWSGVIDTTFVDKYGPGSGATPAHEIDNLAVSVKPLLHAEDSIENAESLAAEIRNLSETLKQRGEQKQTLETLTAERDAFKQAGPFSNEDLYYGATDGKQPADVKIHLRGNQIKLGDVAVRRNLQILGKDRLPPAAGSGRLQLAEWLTAEENPLFARVMVNRIWQQHFGRGLAGSENDFGNRGELPTHPELLDWLATRFKESRWSIKAMHRLMMNSAAYQQSSNFDIEAAEHDPNARFLWRFNRRRLSAEEIRDAMLLVSGNLDPTPGGAHPFPPVETWGFSQHTPFYAVYPTNRRSIYLMQQRLKRHPFLALFDGADTNVSTARRELTTVPTQALYLMNSPFVHQQAEILARKLTKEASDQNARVELAWQTAMGHPPTSDQLAENIEFLKRYTAALSESGVALEARELMVWSAFSRTLLTRNEFLFVD